MKEAVVFVIVALAAVAVWAQLSEGERSVNLAETHSAPTVAGMPVWHLTVDNFPDPQNVAGGAQQPIGG